MLHTANVHYGMNSSTAAAPQYHAIPEDDDDNNVSDDSDAILSVGYSIPDTQEDHGTSQFHYFLLSLLSLFLITEQGGIFQFYFSSNRLFLYILFYFLLFLSD